MLFSSLLQTLFAPFFILVLVTLDIWLTFQGQKLYRKYYARFVDVESYELNPLFADAVKKNQYPFLHALRTGPIVGIVFFLQFFIETSPEALLLYQVLVGALLSLFLVVNASHVANILFYTWVGRHLEYFSGQLSMKHAALLAQMRTNMPGWFLLVLIAFFLQPSYWLLGMLLGLFGMFLPVSRKEKLLTALCMLLVAFFGHLYILYGL